MIRFSKVKSTENKQYSRIGSCTFMCRSSTLLRFCKLPFKLPTVDTAKFQI